MSTRQEVLIASDVMDTLKMYRADAPRLIFLDPPFNIGEQYDSIVDCKPKAWYLEWLLHVLDRASEVLADDGSLWVHLPDQWVAQAKVHLDQSMNLENWIIWHYRFGQCRPTRFINSKCHGLWYSKGNPHVNTEAGLVASDRESLYADWRTPTGLRMDLDVWGFERFWGRVQGNNQERRPLHPNQLPEKYLERIIRLTTNKGDLILDPFVGSGTSVVVAKALGRQFIGGDVSEQYIRSTRERLEKGAVRVSL